MHPSSNTHNREHGNALRVPKEDMTGDLEGHLRSLALAGAAAQHGERTSTGSNVPGTSAPSGLGHAPPLSESRSSQDRVQPAGPSPPTRPRRRPNQAQRREMNAQLTLPIDPAASLVSSAPFSTPYPAAAAAPRRVHPRQPSAYRDHRPQASFDNSQNQAWPQGSTLQCPQTRHNPSPWPVSTPQAPSDTAPSPFASRARHHEPPSSYGRGRGHAHPASSTMWRDQVPTAHQGHWPPTRPRAPCARDNEALARQARLLERLYTAILSEAEIDRDDISQKESLRVALETLCRHVISKHEREEHGISSFPELSVQLKCFGSLSSGFATKASDMDLGLLSPMSTIQPDAPGSPIPRLIETAFLETGLGARLLTRTRVPIIKLCEHPPPQLLGDLRKERERLDSDVGVEEPDATDERDLDNTNILGPVLGDQQGAATLGNIGIEEASPSHPKTTTTTMSREDANLADCGDGSPQLDSAHGNGLVRPGHVSLSQAESQSLSAYYMTAKRVLRKLGGHDITASNHRSFTGEDSELLVAISRAFLSGLSDEALRERLFPLLDPQVQHGLDPRDTRSFLGIYTQVEGEAVLMQWECRSMVERTDGAERAVANAFGSWRALQSKPVFGFELIRHTKELQASLDRLKKFPSVQLGLLEQGQSESASDYTDRSARLLLGLIPRYSDSGRHVEHEVLEKYISGIYHDDVRTDVADLSRALGDGFSFRAAVRKHKALQLANQFEKALTAGLYSDAAKDAVTHYIALLRGPMEPVHTAEGRHEWAIPITESSAHVLAAIRFLSDPSNLAPNKPRDPYTDKLEFPKTGAGVQCDINFSAHLALQNTLLLRCYSHSDPRVRPLVLLIKHWAKARGINTPYRGTLSSYGYVLMALHYLVNVAKPFVCPNLQKLAPPPPPGLSPEQMDETLQCKGRDTRFWRDEQEIARLSRENRLNQNKESVGELLRGFFEYYAHGGALSSLPGRGFDWGREVLSLRTAEGLLTKQEKGWTGAKTTTIIEDLPPAGEALKTAEPSPAGPVNPNGLSSGHSTGGSVAGPVPERPTPAPQKNREVREVRHRYLLAIEDPFELDHNVARTVTHNGIVSIRDEFRRAWRIIQQAGLGREDEDLLRPVDIAGTQEEGEAFIRLLDEIHGITPHDVKAERVG